MATRCHTPSPPRIEVQPERARKGVAIPEVVHLGWLSFQPCHAQYHAPSAGKIIAERKHEKECLRHHHFFATKLHVILSPLSYRPPAFSKIVQIVSPSSVSDGEK
jgi:hypothetical protein